MTTRGDVDEAGPPVDRGTTMTEKGRADLLDAVLSVANGLDLTGVLERFVTASVELTGASFGALNVLDARGTSTTFVQVGVSPAIAAMLRHAPHNIGVLGQIPDEGVLALDDLTHHPAFRGFPANHPPMGSFLGTAVRVREKVYGYLYLAQKQGGFTDADTAVVTALAASAGVALANAQLYADAARREHWLRAGQDITTMLLSGADEAAALALPGVGGELVIELADGHAAESLIGSVMPSDGPSWSVMGEGRGLLVESLSQSRVMRVLPMRAFGPALFAPL